MNTRTLRTAFWTMLVPAAALGLIHLADVVRSQITADAVEGSVLVGQLGLLQGIPLYDASQWSREPFRTNIYGPVFYYAGALLMRLWHGAPTLAAGRIVSTASLIASLAIVWLLARRHLGLRRSSSLAAVLIALSSTPVWQFAALNRVDMLAVALSLGGVLLALEGGWKSLLSPVVFVIAIYTKPTSLAAPLAMAVGLAAERRLRELGIGAAVFLLLCGGSFLALQAATHGAFFTSVIRFNQNALHLRGGLDRTLAASATLVLPLASVAALAAAVRRRDAYGKVSLYLLGSMAVALATVSKVGAALNYFLESGLLAGLVLARWWEQRPQPRRWAAVATLVAAALLVVSARGVREQIQSRQRRERYEARLRTLMQGTFTITPELSTLLSAGGIPAVQDPYVFARLAESGVLDQRPLLNLVNEGRIDLVVADADLRVAGSSNLWTRELCEAITRRYALYERIGSGHYVYREAHPAVQPARGE